MTNTKSIYHELIEPEPYNKLEKKKTFEGYPFKRCHGSVMNNCLNFFPGTPTARVYQNGPNTPNQNRLIL